MTTLVYREGTLAADTMGTVAGWIDGADKKKLFRLKDGRAAGVTGDYAAALRLVRWIDSNRVGEQPTGECRVIVLLREGGYEIFEDGGNWVENPRFAAWGSGMPAALGALHMDATADEAVKVAGKIDPHTGKFAVLMRIEESANVDG